MLFLLAGIACVILGWWVLKAYAKAGPARVARMLRGAGALLCLGLAGLLLLRGRVDVAVGLGALGLWLGADAYPPGLRLAEAYLDRLLPGRRQHVEGEAHPRGGRRIGEMTAQEAEQVLGLQAGAGEGAIRAAHRALIKKLHPDQGGSTYLAARVNEAKDVLLAALLSGHR